MGLIVVTGATGHVGANLVRELLRRGERVRAIVLEKDPPPALHGLDIECVPGDVRDPESLRRAFKGAEMLYHLAAQISIVGEMGGLVHATNVVGVRNVGVAALESGVRRMVHMCSVHAFQQEPLDEPLDETRARVTSKSAPAYDRSKAAGEAEVRALIAEGLDAVIVHPSGIIGPFDYQPSRMGHVFLDLYHRKLPSLLDGGFDWVDVRDVVAGSIAALERGRTGESYLLSGRWCSIGELARIAERLTGVKPPRFTSPRWLARIGAPFLEGWAKLRRQEPLYTAESLVALGANRNYVRTKSERELGHQPRPTEDSVRDVYRWFASHGRVPPSLLERIESGAAPADTRAASG
jgi:dihydroflavonol-4-reductase